MRYECPDYFSPDLKDFLSKTLERNVEARMTVEKALNHPWLVEMCDVYQRMRGKIMQ